MGNALAHRFFLFAASTRDSGDGRERRGRKAERKVAAELVVSKPDTHGKTDAVPHDNAIGGVPQGELLARLGSDDFVMAEQALEIVHKAFYSRLWRVAYQALGSPDLAEEAVQEVFVYLWEQRQALTIRGTLGVYLHVATRNAAYKLLRHGEVIARHAVVTGDNPALAGKSAMWPSQLEGPLAALAETEANRALFKALERLSERDRAVLVLRWREGWEFDEIGKLLGMSSVAARTVVLRQQRRLRVFLDRLREELKAI